MEKLRAADPVMDCLWETFEYELERDAIPLRRRLAEVISDHARAEAHVSVAPVHFNSRLFHIDEEGIWSVLIPMTDETGWIVNIAAFDPDGPRVATLNLEGCAAGLEELSNCWILESSFRPRVHLTMWSWLKGQCSGILPVRWRTFAHLLLKTQVDGIIATDAPSGRIIARRLEAALRPPPVFIAAPEAEVAA